MRLLSEINACSLTTYSGGTKKQYSGLCGNFIPLKNPYPSLDYKEWEFGFKQRKEKLDIQKHYQNPGYHRDYPILDYNSAFAVFHLMYYPSNFWNILCKKKKYIDKPAFCRFILYSTDDGWWEVSFKPEYLQKFKSFMIHNHIDISLEKIEEYVLNKLEGWKE